MEIEPDRCRRCEASLQRWAALPKIPDVLPGEDRTFGSGLFVDPVPASCWFTNVRTCVIPRDWERLHRMIIRRAGHRCEICGRAPDRTAGLRLEAHERWAYNEHASVQALRRLICLCRDCHLVTHFGYARVSGQSVAAFAHLKAVTGMTDPQALERIGNAAAIWERRSARTWSLDLRALTDAGVTVVHHPRPPPAPPRPNRRSTSATAAVDT